MKTVEISDEEIKACVPEGLTLFPFQYSGVRFLFERSRALIASDPGTGKTVMLITAANAVQAKAKKDIQVQVFCPKSMLLTWEREIKKWGNPFIKWHVLNWDKLSTAGAGSIKLVEKLNAQTWDIVIADESHQAIKNPKAVKCKRFFDYLIPSAKRTWLATATPASRSGLDYYCTLKVLLPTLFSGWTAWQFQERFCQEKYDRFAASGKKFEGFKNTLELKQLFSKCAIRHRKEEVLPDLPPKIFSDIEVEVDESIVAEHLDIDVEYVIDLIERGEPLPGHIAHVMQATAHAKMDDTIEWIMNFPENENLVVFAWHRTVVDAIVHRLRKEGVTVDKITGEIASAERRQEVVDKFMSGELKRLVLNMQSGGVGLTLTKARTALYIEFPHSPIYWRQSQDRVHRVGSVGENVQIVKMVGKKTIDEAIFNALQERIEKINEIGV